MPVDYNFRKGIDFPIWQWLPFPPFINYHGCSQAFDGTRHIYWTFQSGTTSAASSTTYLCRYDTWTNAWAYMVQVTNSGFGLDIEYDPKRNVLYLLHGANLTTWQVYNLNATAITIGGITVQPWTLANMTPALPATAGYGASFTLPSDLDVGDTIESGTATTGSTATVLYDTATSSNFGSGMVGLQVRYTAGALAGQVRTIVSVQSPSQLTTVAFTAAPAVGDAYVVEYVTGTATSGTTTALTETGKGWAANQYRDADVIITGGTGSGQRRRIASNTADTLTVAVAFATAPDATSTYQVVTNSDLLFYQRGSNGGEIYYLDLSATTLAWSVNLGSTPAIPGGGANTFFPKDYAPHSIIAVRGAGTNTVYQFSVGLRTWTTLLSRGTVDTFNTGATSALLHGHRRVFAAPAGLTQRVYAYDLTTGVYEPFPVLPYAPPAGYDGKRGRMVTTPDGADYFYWLRPGSTEFFRLPLEWLGDV